MSFIDRHLLRSLLTDDRRQLTIEDCVQGMLVSHVDDEASMGIVVAIEGLETIVVMWSKFSRIVFPSITRRVITSNTVGVQPMTVPSGNIFYVDYTYGKGGKK